MGKISRLIAVMSFSWCFAGLDASELSAQVGQSSEPSAQMGLSSPSVQESSSSKKDAAAEIREPELPSFLESGETEVIARIEGVGGYVEWTQRLDDASDRSIGVGIGMTFPYKPLISARFIENRTPLEVYMAIAPWDEAIPEPLIIHAQSIGQLRVIDSTTRDNLRRENEYLLRDFKVEGSNVPQSCSQAFKNWVGQVFGDATCGAQNSGQVLAPASTYCTSGCDRPLGSVDKGACQPQLASCDIVRGEDHYYRGRLTNWNGNAWMAYWGRWQHFLAANCSGNGPIVFHRQRGSTTHSKSVPVNHAYHYYWGSWPTATAETNVTYGLWSQGLNPSGPGHQYNKAWLTYNGASNDRAILCGDIRFKRVMSDVSSPSCHGPNVSLCTTAGSCTSACFKCVGGIC